MGRTILGMLVGVAVMVLVILGVEMVGHHFYPPPAGLDPMDPAHEAAFAQFVAEMPVAGKATVVLAWALGAFVGGLVAARVAVHQRAAAVFVALVVMSGVMAMIRAVPHPGWMAAAGLVLPIPLALLAAQLVYRRRTLPRV